MELYDGSGIGPIGALYSNFTNTPLYNQMYDLCTSTTTATGFQVKELSLGLVLGSVPLRSFFASPQDFPNYRRPLVHAQTQAIHATHATQRNGRCRTIRR
eukprot:COSAG01_NODE_16584_length_1223_cov_2.925267_2_plen_100_part_00